MSTFDTKRHKKLLVIIFVGVLLRLFPIWIWGVEGCVRDECSYIKQAYLIVKGKGVVATTGWLWAPGYSTLLALHKVLFDSVYWMKYTQVVLSVVVAVLLYRLSADERRGLWACGLYMFSPVQIFFAQSLWSETVYGAVLIGLIWLFHKRVHSGWLGLILAAGILLRGVALYLVLIVGFFVYVRRQSTLRLLCAVFFFVAPYSLYASYKFDRFIVSDRTLGQMLWLGNNDFQPMTFDWGNGATSNFAYERNKKKNTYSCPPRPKNKKPKIRNRWSMERQDCLMKQGYIWIQNNPTEFVSRIPLRIAQMMTPHSFLTRHLRSGGWRGISEWWDELIIIWSASMSLLVLWTGCIGLVQNRKNDTTQLTGMIFLYHVLCISLLAGLSRYRVPLEPLLMLYAGSFLGGDWREVDRRTVVYIFVVLTMILPLSLWFLPSGWSWWRNYF
ncbi:MAG: hypothetical protein CL916_07365 [Deltaproteobacteria bacterium]|nr:hypothetical protein [Deltaproteobacteria bacterium]